MSSDFDQELDKAKLDLQRSTTSLTAEPLTQYH